MLIEDRHNETIRGVDVTHDSLPDTKNLELLTLRNCTNLVIEAPQLHGSKRPEQGFSNAAEGEHGIGVHGCSNIRITDPVVHDVHGDFLYLGPHGAVINEDITVERPDFLQSGRQGISALSVRRLTVTGPGRVWGFRNSGVDTERQFGARSIHEDIHIDRDTVDFRSWRKMRRSGDVSGAWDGGTVEA